MPGARPPASFRNEACENVPNCVEDAASPGEATPLLGMEAPKEAFDDGLEETAAPSSGIGQALAGATLTFPALLAH